MLKGKFIDGSIAISLFLALLLIPDFSFPQSFERGLEKIRVGTPSPSSIAVLQLRIANLKGFFREEGLEVEVIAMRVPVSVVALTTKDIDYATPAGTILVSAIKGLPVKIVMYFLRVPLHVLVVRPEIRSIQELKGKLVGIGGFGEATEPMLRAMLGLAKMDMDKDVKVVPVSGSGNRFVSLTTGLLEAAVLPPPYNLQAEAKGYRRLMSVAEVPEVIDGTVALAPPTGLGVNVEKLQNNPQQIKRMIRALVKSHSFIRTQKVETTKIISDWLKVDRSMASGAYDMYVGAMSEDGLVGGKVLESAIEQVRQESKVKEKVPVTKVIDFTIAREALVELGVTRSSR